jgi:hypothetical protein
MQQTTIKPSILMIYKKIKEHREHTKNHPCDHCYPRGERSLVIQNGITKHIKEIIGNSAIYVPDSIAKDLETAGLASYGKTINGNYMMTLRQRKTPGGHDAS